MVAVCKLDVVCARIEPKVKRDAENIVKRLGVSHWCKLGEYLGGLVKGLV